MGLWEKHDRGRFQASDGRTPPKGNLRLGHTSPSVGPTASLNVAKRLKFKHPLFGVPLRGTGFFLQAISSGPGFSCLNRCIQRDQGLLRPIISGTQPCLKQILLAVESRHLDSHPGGSHLASAAIGPGVLLHEADPNAPPVKLFAHMVERGVTVCWCPMGMFPIWRGTQMNSCLGTIEASWAPSHPAMRSMRRCL